MTTNLPTWPYEAPRKEETGEWGNASGLDELMISAVSDFSGLDGIMQAAKEEVPVVRRFSHVPEFPELLPEVRAELEEIQASMDAARTEREAGKKPTEISDSVSDEVDRIIISVPSWESVNVSASLATSSELPSQETEIRKVPTVVEVVRWAQIGELRSRIAEIFSTDPDFPTYHAKAILDLCDGISVRTSESELADLGTLLLYLSETLGVFFNRETQWSDHRHRYLASAVRASEAKFRLKSIRLLSPSEETKSLDDPKIMRTVQDSFDRDYERWHRKFLNLLKRNGGKTVTNFKTDFSSKPYGLTVERCLESVFALWKEVFLENRRIKADLTKVHGKVLLRKIHRIQKEFDFSDVGRYEEIEAPNKRTFRSK